MGNMSGIKVTDVLGLSAPLIKLVETVAGGVGKLYEPIHVKRMAQARREEIGLISETISDFGALPIKYDSGVITIDGRDCTELVKRTQERMRFQEVKKQNNIDHVVGYAAQNLCNEEQVSDQPVDIDWITRFFDSVSDVSSEDMQLLWGKILAGEVKRPGKFSFRTLETIRNMSQKDAKLFVKIAPFVMSCYSIATMIKHSSIISCLLENLCINTE